MVACPSKLVSSQSSRTITFSSGAFTLVGNLQLPEGEGKHPAIIIVHGDGRGTKDYYREMRNRFVQAGFATLIWDKPGSGKSTGSFHEGGVFCERAGIVRDAVSLLRNQPSIDKDRIGAWGVSQGGYVLAYTLKDGIDLSFVILVGSPGEDSIQQTAYYMGRQIQCEGYSKKESQEADALVLEVLRAPDYEAYVSNGAELLERFPVVKDIGFMAGILPKDRWTPRSKEGDSYFDPVPIMEKVNIPVLAFFGELDTNVDPHQGVKAYLNAIENAGNPTSEVILFPGVDHDMVPSQTGCEKERRRRISWKVHPEYLNKMIQWLQNVTPNESLDGKQLKPAGSSSGEEFRK